MADSSASISVVLVCIGGPDNGKRVAITEQAITIGRSSSCEVPSDDPEAAEKHVSVQLKDGKPSFMVFKDCIAMVDGQRKESARLEYGQQLRIGRSFWQLQRTGGGGSTADVSSFFGGLGERISEFAGVEKIEGFKISDMFSEVFRKRSDEEMENYFAVGTPSNTPKLTEVETSWPKPWLFFKMFALAAVIYLGFVLAYDHFQNENLIPGLIIIGSFVMPFTLLILFFEVNVLRNVPLYQVLKLLFLGGILSLIVTLCLYQWTNWGKNDDWLSALGIGIVEETGKAAALLLVLNKPKYRWTLNGMLFGAAVGAGFAGFESAGYAFHYGFGNITTRAWLCLLGGHVLWTALVGAALWRVRGDSKFEWSMLQNGRFLRVFALAVGMHMVWDAPWEPSANLKYFGLGFVAWVALLSYIQFGLRQIRAAQATGATEFFRKQKTAVETAANPKS